MPRCSQPNTGAEDGTPSQWLICRDCGAVLIEPPDWKPAYPPRVQWIKRVLT